MDVYNCSFCGKFTNSDHLVGVVGSETLMICDRCRFKRIKNAHGEDVARKELAHLGYADFPRDSMKR